MNLSGVEVTREILATLLGCIMSVSITSHDWVLTLRLSQIPPWDFSVKSLALADRDSSAAAIVASGLVELDGCLP